MSNVNIAANLLKEHNMHFIAKELLSEHCSFKIGGNADIFYVPNNIEDLIVALNIFRQNKIRYFILGKGSNVLFSDIGFEGAVISTKKLDNISVCNDIITAQAGATLTSVCNKAKLECLAGLEFAFGIPGSVGGAIFMNAGAYGGEMKDVIESVQCINNDDDIITLDVSECELGYRNSVFQTKELCIVSVNLKLSKCATNDEISERMADYARRRADKQPLDMPSAGSAFKRPEGAFAGQLIDKCNLRGYTVGGAAISEKHCGFIVNKGNATCNDVIALATEVCATVKAQTGYDLEKEIRVISYNGER